MLEVKLLRTRTCDEGTRGILIVDAAKTWCMLELPWRDNIHNISCIPDGKYIARVVPTVHHGKCYQLENVPDRSSILIHAGNWAGDINKGMKSDSQGCLLIGDEIKIGSAGQLMICNSKISLKNFMAYTKGQPLNLEIRW